MTVPPDKDKNGEGASFYQRARKVADMPAVLCTGTLEVSTRDDGTRVFFVRYFGPPQAQVTDKKTQQIIIFKPKYDSITYFAPFNVNPVDVVEVEVDGITL